MCRKRRQIEWGCCRHSYSAVPRPPGQRTATAHCSCPATAPAHRTAPSPAPANSPSCQGTGTDCPQRSARPDPCPNSHLTGCPTHPPQRKIEQHPPLPCLPTWLLPPCLARPRGTADPPPCCAATNPTPKAVHRPCRPARTPELTTPLSHSRSLLREWGQRTRRSGLRPYPKWLP